MARDDEQQTMTSERLAEASRLVRAHHAHQRLEHAVADVDTYLESVQLRDADWPIYRQFEESATMLLSVLRHLATSEQMTVQQAADLLENDRVSRSIEVIVESPEIGYRVVRKLTSRGSYKTGYFLECRSRLKSRGGEWVTARGPYVHQQTAEWKLHEREAEAKAPTNARVFPSIVE